MLSLSFRGRRCCVAAVRGGSKMLHVCHGHGHGASWSRGTSVKKTSQTCRLHNHRRRVSVQAFGITFGIPGAIQTEINNDFGGLAPLVTLVLFVYVNGQIQKFRREQEEKAMKAAGEAMSEAAKETVEGITQEQWAKLALCVLIDLAGDSSFLLPGLGELSDGVYAPIEAFALNSLFSSGALGGIGFVEEALPFSDALPTATVAWMLQTLAPESGVTKALGIKPPSPKEKTSEVTEE